MKEVAEGRSVAIPCVCNKPTPIQVLRSAGVPEVVLQAVESNTTPKQIAEKSQRALVFAASGMDTSTFITGGYGTGKTVLAARMALHAIRAGHVKTFRFAWIPALLREIKGSFEDGETSEAEILDRCAKTHLLVLDDLGSELVSKWAAATVAQMLCDRYNSSLRTIVTSNLDLAQIGEVYGPRLLDRMTTYRVLTLTGASLRRSPRRADA